ncbi:MAG: type II 3-dehydroquinate dehydratase [Deltaproteobacteria bacterium]|nr:MAG: type II 3-dehydroquinate dehydratase [Deltaproteobacteria bacterium]
MKFLVINGPNLNLLGKRERDVYGSLSYRELEEKVTAHLEREGIECEFFQSNSEGEIVEAIQSAAGKVDGIVINPAAYTHTSIAIRDALLGTGIPAVEVHISNVYAREDFRRKSLIEDVVVGKVCGFGWFSYVLGARGLAQHLSEERK